MYQAGAVAAYATMAAAVRRSSAGCGRTRRHLYIRDAIGLHRPSHEQPGGARLHRGSRSSGPPMGTSGTTSQAYPCADGYLEATVARGYVQRVIGMLRPLGYFQESKWDNPDTYGQPGTANRGRGAVPGLVFAAHQDGGLADHPGPQGALRAPQLHR